MIQAQEDLQQYDDSKPPSWRVSFPLWGVSVTPCHAFLYYGKIFVSISETPEEISKENQKRNKNNLYLSDSEKTDDAVMKVKF